MPNAQRKLATWTIAVAVGLTALLAAGCGDDGRGSSGGETQLKVATFPIADFAPMFVAEDRGYFKAEGLDVNTAGKFSGGAAVVPAVESGAIDLSFSNVVSIIQATERGLPLRCFAGALAKPEEGGNLVLAASPKSDVRSVADLAGKTIAVNTLKNINELVADTLLDKHGVDPASVSFRPVDFPDMPGVLASGQVDAALMEEPFASLSRKEGARIIDAKPYAAIGASPLFSCWFSTKDWIEGNKQSAEAFVRALDKAIQYGNSHEAATKAAITKHTEVSTDIASKLVLPRFTTEITPADLQPWIDAAVKYKIIEKPVSASDVIQTP